MSARGKRIALLVAAGSGSRVGGLPKQYRRVAGRPVIVHAIAGLRHHAIDEIRVVIGQRHEALYEEAARGLDLPSPIRGGATRRQSVRNGLEAIAREGGAEAVLIHDAARPWLAPAIVDRLIEALERAEGAVPVLPIADTVAERGNSLGAVVDRDRLVRVQTPQAFRFPAILAAHRSWQGSDASDDAQMLRAAGGEVAMVEGDPMLDKITFESDLARAEAMIAPRLVSRTGMGFDVHAFTQGEDLWLGGIRIAHERGLKGHSDADVALHALTDALLGAAGLGDIGDHFPPSDPQWRGAASSRFVEHARDLIAGRGGIIDHVDLTIICEAPRIGPHRQQMREHVAGLLRLPLSAVSIKATTTERLGFAGRGEGIAAQAVATIRLGEEA